MNWQYHLVANRPGTVRELLSNQLLIPKHLIYRLRTDKRVTVNHRYLPMNFQVAVGDQIQISFEPDDFNSVQPPLSDCTDGVQVLFETNDVIVVNKHRGDKTHPNQPGERGATINHVAAYLAPAHQQPYIIHRLDQQTSGAIIFGKNPAVVPILTRLISEKRIKRSYLAWVSGTGMRSSGTIDLPIGIDPNDQRKRMVNGPHSLNAITHYQVIRTSHHMTLLKIELSTGRTHQIRVHLAAIGHPLVGDPLYNPTPGNALQLHSYQLDLIQPFTMEHHLITAPLPTDFYM
ncbi:RluA family pseudouridine synthase [Nicoliella spurrieriana]|uniref:RNA pseudouridylate synthase n=1 Tax=Nicoliella spurrieriana TaxID=2925830 RepID=A0A976RSV4_9LACO|nr:RluA family pseudouridine synthase [Nicoliella spurrieriana]UQS87161.1 RluA family pseudouridine synthase [Nicoliella spurrieriana]